jgi:ribonuclease Z
LTAGDADRPQRAALRLGELSIEGWSRAGEETWFRVHPPGLAFDCGRGALELSGARDLFVSHGHLDHALGVPWVLSQRTLHHREPTRVVCPREVAADLGELIEAAARLERVRYGYEILPVGPGDRVEVGRDLAVVPFATEHVVPSLGFHLLRRRHHLRAALRGLDGTRLAALRRAGTPIEDESEEVWLSYCGDTAAGVFERAPRLVESRVLMIECTFLGGPMRRRGSEYGHLHVEDLAERADQLAGCEAILLHHLSRRHTVAELRGEVERLMPDLAPRVHLLFEGAR